MFKKELQYALEENVQREDVSAKSKLSWMLSHNRLMWLFSRILTFNLIINYYLFKTL